MIMIGKRNCPCCKKVRAFLPDIKYIEIPDVHIGLGDTISAITSFFGITPCRGCMIRRHWCNEWFPYKRNIKQIPPEIIQLKQKIILSTIKTYPIFMDDNMDHFIPLEYVKNHTGINVT